MKLYPPEDNGQKSPPPPRPPPPPSPLPPPMSDRVFKAQKKLNLKAEVLFSCIMLEVFPLRLWVLSCR